VLITEVIGKLSIDDLQLQADQVYTRNEREEQSHLPTTYICKYLSLLIYY